MVSKLEKYYIPYGPVKESHCIFAWESIRSPVGRKQLILFNPNIYSFLCQVFVESLLCARHVLFSQDILSSWNLCYGEKNW